MKQREVVDALEQHLGHTFSVAAYSAMERSGAESGHRGFTIDEIAAFARVFELPMMWFLLPQASTSELGGIVQMGDSEIDAAEYVRLILEDGTPGDDGIESRLQGFDQFGADLRDALASEVGAQPTPMELKRAAKTLTDLADALKNLDRSDADGAQES